MTLTSIALPPISKRFYTELLKVFPLLTAEDVTAHVDMITLQRRAGQAEILRYIERKATITPDLDKSFTFLQRLKFLLFNKLGD